ncbi:MAG: hypothetical protein U1A77_22935 [Pirellulales bacterium]
MDDWYTKGCDACRKGILSASWPPPKRLLSLDEWHSFLHQCDECSAYWLYGEREAHVISAESAERMISTAKFEMESLEPIPNCIRNTRNRSLVDAIHRLSISGVNDFQIEEELNADATSPWHNTRFTHLATGLQWMVYLADQAFPGEVRICNVGTTIAVQT